ncbi:MAG: VCBS repeat-containing protein [Planctomycetota bacterium]
MGDFNDDGLDDIAAAGTDGILNTFISTGGGLFQPAIQSPGPNPFVAENRQGSLADHDGDGDLDISWADPLTDSVQVVFGSRRIPFQQSVWTGATDFQFGNAGNWQSGVAPSTLSAPIVCFDSTLATVGPIET